MEAGGQASSPSRLGAVRYFLANWKMHHTVDQAMGWVETVQDGLGERARLGRQVPRPIVCPPFVSLVPLRGLVDGELMSLGAQNCHWEAEGPYTGEVSPAMLVGIADYVMVGHSERRAVGETDDQVADKVAAVTEAGLVPILFVGEEEPADADRGRAERQLRRALAGIDLDVHSVLVVYEPAWAVGAEAAAESDHVDREVHRLKDVLCELGSPEPRVVYGGTVNDENIDQFAELDVLDGVGATRASLDPDRFLGMLDRIEKAKVRPSSSPPRPDGP